MEALRLFVHVVLGGITFYLLRECLEDIRSLAPQHEVAATLARLVDEDGAGAWPPRANHDHGAWPAPLRPYKEIYLQLAPFLPMTRPCLDDDYNSRRISRFRDHFREFLSHNVDREQVRQLLDVVELGQSDALSQEVYNAFYCCIAWCRHAYRWGIIPVVRVAQLERELEIPPELDEPWPYLQRHFGCTSQSGNVTSSLVLNFDIHGNHVFKINTGLPDAVTSAEEAFSRIVREVETAGLPIYREMLRAINAFEHHEMAVCMVHMTRISKQLHQALNCYYTRLHDKIIPHAVWLSHVQGFFAWGIGYVDPATGEWHEFDGLSGNQILLFQALDAFLGLEPYLPAETQHLNMPACQRALCRSLEKHFFRAELGKSRARWSEDEARIAAEFDEIVKQLRRFRSAHRARSKAYLSEPAPERLPMTAGKSLLKPDLELSLKFLDGFMVQRLEQTV
ncbi:hypothetical protein GQ53DRAFT_794661 [Thozetella sp. PMI_491]|nr:hypothetical protein GQ53DRAFT_794661 [Thozetella sp. PMI_491]